MGLRGAERFVPRPNLVGCVLGRLFNRSADRSVIPHKENGSLTDKLDLAPIRISQGEYRGITVPLQGGKRERFFVRQSFRRKNEMNFCTFLKFDFLRERFRDLLEAPVADNYGAGNMDILEHITERPVFVHKPIGREAESHYGTYYKAQGRHNYRTHKKVMDRADTEISPRC